MCFLPGSLALGAANGLDRDGSHMQLAKACRAVPCVAVTGTGPAAHVL